MSVIHIGDFYFPVEATQRTLHALHFMDSSGNVYHAQAMGSDCPSRTRISDGVNVYNIGGYELIYDVSDINKCVEVSLDSGCYRLEIRGGKGGDGGGNSGSGMQALAQEYEFKLSGTSTAYLFRGGDGADGDIIISSEVYSGGGGGASGLDSVVILNGDEYSSTGGAGGRGASARDYNGKVQNCGGGGGGNAVDGDINGMNAAGYYAINNNFYMCGAGGGGAPTGIGGDKYIDIVSDKSYSGEAGESADANAGGTGGKSYRIVASKDGGAGGQSNIFSCGGRAMYSYGGGGGGAIQTKAVSQINLNGGNGGAGTTGISSTSYIRIYKFK